MLLGLGHPAIIGSDYEEREIQCSDPGDHVIDEVRVTGHVDQSDLEVLTTGPGQLQVGEAELDGDSSLLLFGESVRVRSGEGSHEGGLSMVDVTSCSEDEVHREVTVRESAGGFKARSCRGVHPSSAGWRQNFDDAGFLEVEGGHLDRHAGSRDELWSQDETGLCQVTEGDLSILQLEGDCSLIALGDDGRGGHYGFGRHC